jgi:hypothetical protein
MVRTSDVKSVRWPSGPVKLASIDTELLYE